MMPYNLYIDLSHNYIIKNIFLALEFMYVIFYGIAFQLVVRVAVYSFNDVCAE